VKFHGFFSELADQVIRFRWFVILLILILSGLSVYTMSNYMKVDNSFESYFVQDDPNMRQYKSFKKVFGEDTFIYIIYEVKDAFSPKTLEENLKLSEALEEKVPHAVKIRSLTTAEILTGEDDELIIKRIGDELPETIEEGNRWRSIIAKKEIYLDSMVSRDSRFMAIQIPCDFSELASTAEMNVAKDTMTKATYGVLDQTEFKHLHARIVGDPIFNSEYAAWTITETTRMVLYTALMLIFLLAFIFRRAAGVLVPMAIVSVAVLWTFGLMAVTATMSMTSTILPGLLAAVGICDSIHIMAEFDAQFIRLKHRRAALVETIRILGYPCLLTSITTAAGFSSLAIAPIVPMREVGLLAAFGVMVAYLLTVTLIVALLSFGKDAPPKSAHTPEDFFSFKFMGKVARATQQRKGIIVTSAIVLTLVGLYGLSLVKVDTDWLLNFGPDMKIRQDYEYVDTSIGAVGSLEMVFDTHSDGGGRDANLLKNLERLSKKLEADPRIKKVLGLPALLAEINRALHNGDESFYRVPDTRQEIAQMLLLYENAGGGDVADYIDMANRALRLTLLVTNQTDIERKKLLAFINQSTDEIVPRFNDHKADITGLLVIAVVLSDMVVPSQIKSFMVAFGVIALLLMIFFRSLTLGLIGMIPTTLPVFITSGVMGYTGIYLDWVITMIASVGIGLSVDNTIHLFSRFRHEYDLLGNYQDAMSTALQEVGRALMFTGFVLALGFGVTTTSVMVNVARFGELSALLILLSLSLCLLLAPVLLVWLKPFGSERNPTDS